MRIVLSGGGTGGHITPIVAIATALRAANNKIELIYIGEGAPAENQLNQIKLLQKKRIWSGKWRRYHNQGPGRYFDLKTLALNLRDSIKLGIGLIQSLYLLWRLHPDAVFVKGGYVGLPVGLAAAMLKVRLVIHESDVVAGATNRVLGRYASVIATGFPPEHYPYWPASQIKFTGQLIRAELLSATTAQGRAYFGLEAGITTLLILGGSSGARGINRAITALLPQLLDSYQVIHITGQKDFQALKNSTHLTPKAARRYKIYAFLDRELGLAYRVADIIVSRAGMSSVAESAAFGKPLILVPAPQLGHQLRNAEILQTYGVKVIFQDQLKHQLPLVLQELQAATTKPGQTEALKKLINPQAAESLAKLIMTQSS